MKKLYLTFLSILCVFSTNAQTYTWAATDIAYHSSGRGVVTTLTTDHSNSLIVAYGPQDNYYHILYADIVKYDAGHHLLWKKRVETLGMTSFGFALCTDKNNNIFFTSSYSGSLIVDSVQYAANGGGNVFLVKFDNQGNCMWVRNTSGGTNLGRKINCDEQGNVYLAGNINGTANLDTIQINSPVAYNFVAKYTGSGNFQWVKYGSQNSQSSSYGLGFRTDKAGNSYFPSSSQFINKFGANGNFVWANLPSNVGNEAMTADDSGNVYITGVFLDSTDLGNYHLPLTPANGRPLWRSWSFRNHQQK